MGKALRWSEKWFHRALWLVALIFASFLIGLGGLVVGDLPRVESNLSLDQFIDFPRADGLRKQIADDERESRLRHEALEENELVLTAARNASRSARETFANWIATRRATAQGAQDEEVLRRTRELDMLKVNERKAEEAVEQSRQANHQAEVELHRKQDQLRDIEAAGYDKLAKAQRKQELKVFLVRLAFTLPLLAIGGWLFAKKRKTLYWPFVWGFIFFALFAFFVELVPYLPSYGGYVRYIVGILLTALIGRYAILALQRYRLRQELAESRPDLERRKELDYEVAQLRLSKGVCPGCERKIDLKNEANNFCPHCGICLFDHCGNCATRKNAFAHFCHACGAGADDTPPITASASRS